MIAAVVLTVAVAVGAGAWPPPPGLTAVPAVPDEPGVVVLPERQTYQAVVADLEGNGSRDLVRLVHGVLGSIQAEVWRHGPGGWEQVGDEVEVIPELANGSLANVIYAGTPARLIVRAIGDRERVTLVRQPRFEEPGAQPPCCLQIHDLHVEEGEVRLRSVGAATDGVDAVLALDLDGDGIDELLATRSLPPLGRTAYPMEALLYRWRGGAFAAPVVTELPIGSGDTPFVLGDTDGHPGVEAGIITTAAQGVLHRLVLGDDDTIRAETSGFVVTDAKAVPVGDGRGIAILGPLTGLAVHPWPPGNRLADAVARLPMARARLVELVELRSGPALLVEQLDPTALHVLAVPGLEPSPGITLTRSAVAAAIDGGPLEPYRGPLPGGGTDGGAAAIYAGQLLPLDGRADVAFPALEAGRTVAFAGVEPIGLAGPHRAWLALLHGGRGPGRLDPAGGRLDAPALRAASGISLVPLELVREPEVALGELAPETTGALALDERGTLAVGPSGFVAQVRAPPGSRVYIGDADPSVIAGTRLVPESGELPVPLPPPGGTAPNPGYRATITVVSPAGASYVASWTVRTLSDAPPLSASAETDFGSPVVAVSGTTAPYASVTVDGRRAPVDAAGRFTADVDLPPWPTAVRVVALDPLGNVAEFAVSGVGWIDYRGLPWPWIAGVVVAAAAVALYLRAPRPAPVARPAGDDATFEELDPD